MINFVIFRLRGYFLKTWIRKRVLNSVIGADKAERLLAEAAGKGAEVVVFPEAFVGGYPQGSTLGVAVANTTEKNKLRRRNSILMWSDTIQGQKY